MKNFLVLAIIASFLTSCCVSEKVGRRKIARIVNCNPSIVNSLRDTMTIRIVDTIVTEPKIMSFDGVLVDFDTLIHVSENGIVTRIVRVPYYDTIEWIDTVRVPYNVRIPFWLETICPSDTVFIDTTAFVVCPDPIIVTTDRDRENSIRLKWSVGGAIVALLLFALFSWGVSKIKE